MTNYVIHTGFGALGNHAYGEELITAVKTVGVPHLSGFAVNEKLGNIMINGVLTPVAGVEFTPSSYAFKFDIVSDIQWTEIKEFFDKYVPEWREIGEMWAVDVNDDMEIVGNKMNICEQYVGNETWF